MARIILQNESLNIKSTPGGTQTSSKNSILTISKKRSKDYIKMMMNLDLNTLTETQGMETLLNKIKEEFGSVSGPDELLGIVSKCFLGHPFEVHTLDLTGSIIIRHYERDNLLPDNFEKARVMAIHNAYALVEVYKDKMILVREDGSTTKI